MPVEMLTYADLGERLKISPGGCPGSGKKAPMAAFPFQRRQNAGAGRPHRNQPFPDLPSAASAGRSTADQRPKAENRGLAGRTARGEGHRQRPSGRLREGMRAYQQAPGRIAQGHLGRLGRPGKAALLEGKLSMLTQPWRRRLIDAFSLALPQVAARESGGSIAQSHS